MGWWNQLQSECNDWLQRTGLPRRVLRHLIFAHEIGVGSRVLIAGCGDGELAQFFDRLGFEVVGLNESVGRRILIAGCTGSEESSIQGPGSVNPQPSTLDPQPFKPHQFDLVLVHGLDVYAGTLFGTSALRATAHLLSCVRPGGHLAMLARYERTALGDLVGHTEACFTRHLSHFPGSISTAEFPERLILRERLKGISAHRSDAGFVTASLESPRSPLSRDDWLYWAETASDSPAEFCCDWSLPSMDRSAGRPAA